MITLSTGVPGAGKTLNTIELVEKECQGRAIYYRGIKDLTLPWHLISDDAIKDWSSLPDGSVVVIDECQQVWPNIPSNVTSPPSVMSLDTHRHRGFDFYLITQKPTMVDFRVRGFVGRHYHYERGFGRNGTRQLEFQRAVNDPDDYHTRQDSQIKRLKFNRRYFHVYKSAEIHTVKSRTPKSAYIFGAAILLLIGLSYFGYNSISHRINGTRFDDKDISSSSPVVQETNYENLMTARDLVDKEDTVTNQEYVDIRKPRIKDVPSSAPVYDQVTEVKSFPKPLCIHNEVTDKCKCYSQQVTSLAISHDACMAYIESGWFDPSKDDQDVGGGSQGQALAPGSPSPVNYNNNTLKESPNVVVIGNSGST